MSEQQELISNLPSQPQDAFVKVAVLDGGNLTLPECLFVMPADIDRRISVPSMFFLLEHQSRSSNKGQPYRILFDLGLRHKPEHYTAPQQMHLENREPMDYPSSVSERLQQGNVTTDDIDFIILSHVHWDHTGDPQDFSNSRFIVGNGSLELLQSGLPGAQSHAHFHQNLLPLGRTIELPAAIDRNSIADPLGLGELTWETPVQGFMPMIDFFQDGSVYIVDSPGHLYGHINLLCRVGNHRWLYLAGDAGHDPRLMHGDKEIATWEDDSGNICCIHIDREQTAATLAKVRQLACIPGEKVEVVLAHDATWYRQRQNRLWPAFLVEPSYRKYPKKQLAKMQKAKF